MQKYSKSLISLSLFGLALMVAGFFGQQKYPDLAIFISSIGGAVFGSAFSSIISTAKEEELFSSILSLVENSVTAKFLSEETKLKRYRKLWYNYAITEKNGEQYWSTTKYDFRKATSIGQLISSVTWTDIYNNKHDYIVEGGIRDSRLIFFIKATSSDEPIAIQIMPFMGDLYKAIHCGFWLMVTWDGNNSLMPAIISENPIEEMSDEGRIPKEKQSSFNEIWYKYRKGLEPIFPNLDK